MPAKGVLLLEETRGGCLINTYACATAAVAQGLANAIAVPGFVYKRKPHEFTDSEYADTIGYFASLDPMAVRREIYILYGERI